MSRRRSTIAVWIVLAAALLVAIFPFWWMLVTSFKRPVDIFAGVSLVPQHVTFDNYSRLFGQYHMGDFLRNSVIVVTLAVAMRMSRKASSMTIIAIARPYWVNRNAVL